MTAENPEKKESKISFKSGPVSARIARASRKSDVSFLRRRRWWVIGGSVFLVLVILGTMAFISSRPGLVGAPEAEKILKAQEGLKFGILIPTYMPRGFDREKVELKVSPAGPSGEPTASLTYRNLAKKAAVFFQQWVPGNPQMETLIKSKPIETQWGTGWLMVQGGEEGIATLWVTIGQLRVSVSSSNMKIVSPEQLLQIANTLGLASEDQVYTFNMEPVSIKGVAPPPPFEVPLNSDGVQELNLTITPGGYSPIRFAVKKGVPVKVNFRAIGDVGCGNFLSIDLGNGSVLGLEVNKEKLMDTNVFTPEVAGEFQFNCAHYTFRGMMTVRE